MTDDTVDWCLGVATSRTSTGRALELLERDVELDALIACVEDARRGAGRLLMLEGVAGIGKTRLLGRARELAREQGLRVLSARATELEQDFAFGVVRQLLEPLLFASTPDERAGMFDGAACDALSVFERAPVERETVMAPDSGFTTLSGLYWLLANLAERTPLAMLIDDLQWCDAPPSGSCASCFRGSTGFRSPRSSPAAREPNLVAKSQPTRRRSRCGPPRSASRL